jgi:GT2 family glycosyltransferase
MSEKEISTKPPAISVVLATRGDKLEYLNNCLESLKSQKLSDFELILVAKNFPQSLEGKYDVLNLKFIQENGSTLGAARNLGVRNAKASLVSFIDDDAEASEDWLENIIKIFSNNPSLSCLGGPHFTPDAESKKSPLSFVEGIFFEGNSQKIYLDTSAVGKIAGCNVTYQKKVFDEIGHLNETMRTCEDWEFNRRLLENGYNLRFDPSVRVLHHRQGLDHVFHSYSRGAPFYLSMKSFKLARHDFFIASFYLTNALFFLLLFTLLISPYVALALFALLVLGYTGYNAYKAKIRDYRLIYFSLVVVLSATRLLGFYYGIVKHIGYKLRSLFS